MVKIIVQLKGTKKKIIQNHPTIASAKKTRRFVGRSGTVQIFSRGKLVR